MDDIAIATYGIVMHQRDRFPADNERVLQELVDTRLPPKEQIELLAGIAAAATEQIERLLRQHGEAAIPGKLMPK